MVTELDHNAIKTRIVEILSSSTGLTELGSFTAATLANNMYGGAETRVGARLLSGHPMIGKTLKKCSFSMFKTGTPTGTITCEIYSGTELKATMGTVNAEDLAVAANTYTFLNLSNTYVLQENDVVSVRFEGGGFGNEVEVETTVNNNATIGVARYDSGGNWTYYTYDPWIRMWYGVNASFRSYDVGAPAGNIPNDQPMPYLFVTNDDLIEEDELTSTVKDNAGHTSTHTIRYLIVFMAKGKNGRTVEKLLDGFGKTIKETLKANYDLSDPETGTDPKVASCWPEETRILNRSMIGTEIQGRVIFLKCIAYTS